MASGPASEPPGGAGGYGPQGRSEWLDVDWSAHQRWVDVAGARLNVTELGQGPPIVFIHGHSGCWQNWLETLPHFARAHRVVGVDLPGAGRSPMPSWPITIESYARCIDELCNALGIEVATVVGNSMGGFIGAELAIKFGLRVERLVLVSAAGVSGRYLGVLTLRMMRRPALLAAQRVIDRVMALPPERAREAMLRPGLRRQAFGMVFAHPELLSPGICAEMLQGHAKPGAVDSTRAIATYDFRERIPEIRCPTLIVWGARDRIVPVRGAREYARMIPHARSEIFEDTGHAPMIERPQKFNALLDEFIAQPIRAGGPVDELVDELVEARDGQNQALANEPLSP